nr:hypothetical protein [uncultured Campylobacter sp.]
MGEMASWRKVVRGKFALNLAAPACKFDPNFTSNSPFSSGLDPHLLGAKLSIFRIRVLRDKFVCRVSQIYRICHKPGFFASNLP